VRGASGRDVEVLCPAGRFCLLPASLGVARLELEPGTDLLIVRPGEGSSLPGPGSSAAA
jgi:hypothetical protein